MPPDLSAAARPNPSLTRLRRELTSSRETLVGRQARGLLDALELHCAEQDRRISVLESCIQHVMCQNSALHGRIRDLERQEVDPSPPRAEPTDEERRQALKDLMVANTLLRDPPL